MRERDGGGFVGTDAPGSAGRGSVAWVREAVGDELAPDVTGAVGATAAVNVGGVVGDADLNQADPLGNFGALVVSVRRGGKFGVNLSASGLERNETEQQQREPF